MENIAEKALTVMTIAIAASVVAVSVVGSVGVCAYILRQMGVL